MPSFFIEKFSYNQNVLLNCVLVFYFSFQKMAKAVGDWFYERSTFQNIDCPSLNCNPTCPAVSTED